MPGPGSPVALVYLRPLLAQIVGNGMPPGALLHGLPLLASDFDVPGFRVTHAEAITVIRRALGLLVEPGLGVSLGQRSRLTDQGALALGQLAAGTLREAIELTLRHPRSAGVLLGLHAQPGPMRHTLHAEVMPSDQDLAPFLVDLTFASMVRQFRQVTGADYAPVEVQLVRPRPADAAAYEAHFRCPVRFGCAHNLLASDVSWLDRPLPMASVMSFRLASQLLDGEAGSAPALSQVGMAAERMIRRSLPRLATPADVAASLFVSERSLRRKLALDGLSFRTLLDDGRKAMALELMLCGLQSVAQVATATGFADEGTFRRAFKRWVGVTPAAMHAGAVQALAAAVARTA
jgi:AraC-like DNA-binding protein